MKHFLTNLYTHMLFTLSLLVFLSPAMMIAKKIETPDNLVIRVLLEEIDTSQPKKLVISSKSGFILESPMGCGQKYSTSRTSIPLVIKNSNMFIQCNDGAFKRIKNDDIAISPRDGITHIDKKSYQGTLDLRLNKELKSLQLINKLDLDDYLYSVLLNECLSYWPIQMQMVQAVASRTYAVYQIQQARQQKNAKETYYDIKNTNFHQVYNGNHAYTHLREAIKSTDNQILTYNSSIALTMFDICCGGIIPHNMKKKDEDKPYLFRKNQCTYCKNKSHFTWRKTFALSNFFKSLSCHPKYVKKSDHLKTVTNIRVHEKDKAGIVHSVALSSPQGKMVITLNDLKKSLSTPIKSHAFDLKTDGKSLILEGYGFGHNTGLCQLGARELVSKGWNYKDILQFYYPKTAVTIL